MFNNNNGNGVNINTTFFTSYSDTAMLVVGAWNKMIFVRIHPATGKDMNGLVQYVQNMQSCIKTTITVPNATALWNGFKNEIEPAIAEKREAKVGVTILGKEGEKKILSIGYDGNDAYLEVAVGVNENNATDEAHVITHKFNKRGYISNYKYTDGSGEEVSVESDLYNFMRCIHGIEELVPTVAHSITYTKATKSAAAANNSFNNNANNNMGYSAPISTFNGDMSDFLPMS